MGKASRQRRLRREKERKQRRAAHAAHAAAAARPSAPDRPPRPQDEPPRRGSLRQDAPPRQRRQPPKPEEPSQRELAAAGVIEAIHALAEGRADIFGQYVTALSSRQVAGWAETVSRELVSYLRSSVTAAWRHGWQPAELVRHVGRESGESHARMAIDMIIEELRRYSAATVDDRWLAQLSLLGAELWWGSDDAYLARWRNREEVAQETAVATAVELLLLLGNLPVLPRLGPLPGTARPGTTASNGSATDGERAADERILGKIRALLAKAESTEFADEAEALSARAQELMAKYSIDHALLAAAEGRKDEPAGRRLPVDSPYEAAKASLLQEVAKANRCRAVWHKKLGMSAVIGFPADLDAVEVLFTSLLVQANTAMLHAGAKRDRYGQSRTRAFRQSFLTSYAIRIGERLAEAAHQAEQQAASETPGTALLPVLAARHQAVDDAVDDMFGGALTDYSTGRATDAEGWHSGRAAADMAALHGYQEVTAEPA